MKCPYCSKEDCIPDVAYTHAEHYGSEVSYPRCLFCRKVIQVYMIRRVTVEKIEKTGRKISDW